MTGSIDLFNQYLAQVQRTLETLVFGPRNYVFFGVVGVALIGAVLVRRGFRKQKTVVESSPGVPTAEEYLAQREGEKARTKGPHGGGLREDEEPEAPLASYHPEATAPAPDPELTRRLDAIEEALMRLSAKTDRTAVEPLLRLSEKKIPVEISGTIDGQFDIPLSSLRDVRIAVKQVRDKDEGAPLAAAEAPPAEGD
jgi:hypothetical protein